MFMVAPRGRTKELISGSAPISLQHSMLIGKVALDEVVVNAVSIAGARPLKKAIGLMPDRNLMLHPYTMITCRI